MLWSFVLIIVFGLFGTLAPVPYVAVGPGPTFDTLGKYAGNTIVTVGKGPKTYPTSGQLRMVTVSMTDDLSLFGAMAMWVSGRDAIAPREEYFPPDKTSQQVDKQNLQEFHDSQSAAQTAALRYLKYPTVVLANTIVGGGPTDKKIKAADRIVSVDGTNVSSADAVRAVMKKTKPGQTIPVVVKTGNAKPRTEQIKLSKSPTGDYGFLGLAPQDRADVPFKVDFKLDDVGGPSAGLIFALTVVDKLDGGQLTGGKDIAGTGEIDSAGRVGQIGGINFKVVAAREAGATKFLVPAANCSEAKASAPAGLELIKVDKLDDAVADLKKLSHGDDSVPHC